MEDKRKKYLTVREVADYFSIARSTAYDLISSGELEAKRFGKRTIRVHVDEVKRYERESVYRAGG